jgi:spermidine/putrescine transport system permease protein
VKRNGFFSRLFMALIFLFLYAPIFVLIVFSFNATKSRSVWAGFSLQWYATLFQDSAIIQAVETTLLVSVLASLIACAVGTATALGISAMRRKYRTVVLTVNNIPMTNSDVITGLSLSLLFVFAISAFTAFQGWFNSTFGTDFSHHWFMGFGTMLIAHITFDIPYVVLSVLPKIRQLDPNLYEAAMDLGATRSAAFRKIILPDLMPGIINGLLIAFTMSIDDFVISYFTAGSKVSTLAMEIYAMARRKISPEINAISTLLFVSVLVLLTLVNIRQGRQDRKATRQKAALAPDS